MAEVSTVGVVGDLHGHWDDWDARYFGSVPYDLLLFTGDLGSGTRNDGVRIARSMGRLGKPALVMPGNNDASCISEIAAEFGHQRGLQALLRTTPGAPLSWASGQVRLCGYSVHPLSLGGRMLTLIAARPHAMGGGELSFRERLIERFDVHSMDESAARLCALVDRADTADVLFLAHNGPTGLGERATDLWGCDFRAEAGDFGDPDLAIAIAYAKRQGKNVIAVIAGHMHRETLTGEERAVSRVLDGTLYLNPARVPRIFSAEGSVHRHHSVLEFGVRSVATREVFVDDAQS